MQAHDAAPRLGAAREDVLALIHADDLAVSMGATLLDGLDRPVRDVSHLFDPARTTIRWNGADDMPRSIDTVTVREFGWDADRIRFHRDLSSDLLGLSFRFYRGVFLLTSPDHDVDDRVWVPSLLEDDEDQLDATGAPTAAGDRVVKGWSKLNLLRSKIGATWQTAWRPGGDPPILGLEVERLLAASRWTGPIALHADAYTTEILDPQTWPYDAQGGATFLRVLIDLLTGSGFEKPWDDEVGALRGRPLVPSDQRGEEYVLDANDARTTILAPQRRRTVDVSKVPNSFRYVASSWPRATFDGDGEVLLDPNTSDGPASIAARGVVWNDDVAVDGVTTQEALVAVATARRERDLRSLGVRTVQTGPLPLMGQLDVYRLVDAAYGAPRLAVAREYVEPMANDANVLSSLTVEELP